LVEQVLDLETLRIAFLRSIGISGTHAVYLLNLTFNV
jgi:hypothetical protein